MEKNQLLNNQRRLFADHLLKEMLHNEKIIVVTADLGYKMWDEIETLFPKRFINCGASEQLMFGIAAGLASEGKIPVVYSITPFLLYRATEWIRNYLDHEGMNVKMVGSGLEKDYSHDGFTHHAFGVQQYMKSFPNIECFVPNKDCLNFTEIFDEFITSDQPSLMILRR